MIETGKKIEGYFECEEKQDVRFTEEENYEGIVVNKRQDGEIVYMDVDFGEGIVEVRFHLNPSIEEE